MSDESVAALLRSNHPLVVIEAPAGCGKTFQGAAYAREAAATMGEGRMLILTHTHGACGVFAERTRGLGSRVEIRTIDSLISQIATAYRHALGLPDNLSVWAWENDGEGFDIMAALVAAYLDHHPMIGAALARRYPLVICDEHQDSDVHRHSVIMALARGGSRLRIFGDPMQWIFGGKSERAAKASLARWGDLKTQGAFDRLDFPHRWTTGSPALGTWILTAREQLAQGRPIEIRAPLPAGLRIIRYSNFAQSRTGFALSQNDRLPLDNAVNGDGSVMVLASQNERVQALSAFWNRRIPVWEGHTRSALAALVADSRDHAGNPERLGKAVVEFVSSLGAGFSPSSHGDRLLKEIREGCSKSTTGKPKNIQSMARAVLDNPSHVGVSTALYQFHSLVDGRSDGFSDIKVDHRVELRDAIRLREYDCPDKAYAEISRRRSRAMPRPPAKSLSTIHKAKGLECDTAVVISCDRDQFGSSYYARCKLYVALSRARRSLTLVVSRSTPSPLLQVG